MRDHEKTDKTGEQEKRERPIDRVRRLAEEAGVKFTESTEPGKRTLIFYGSATKGSGGKGRPGPKRS